MATTKRPGRTSQAPKNQIPARPRKTITVVHVIASVALLGEVWALVALNLYSTLAADLELAQAAYRLMEVLVFAGGIPLSMTALISGIVLAVGSHWGLFRHYWVFGKLLLLIAVILMGMVMFQPVAVASRPFPVRWTRGLSRPVYRGVASHGFDTPSIYRGV